MRTIKGQSSVLACGAIVLAGVLAAVLLSHRSSALAATPDLSGVYALRSSSIASELEARRAVIRRALTDIDPRNSIRWHAIVELMAIPEARIRIGKAQGTLSVARGTQPALVSADQGQARTLDGGHELAQRIEGRALVQRIETSSLPGVQLEMPLVSTTRHTLSADRKSLIVETRIEGGALPRPVTFESTYDRI